MKKLIILGVVTLILGVAAAQASRIYWTCCGVPVQTVDEGFFEDPDEDTEYEADLDAIYCNDDCSGPA